MRQSQETLPEILDAYRRDDLHFVAIRLRREEAERVFELGINEVSYRAVRRVRQMRPFDQTPGANYHYFFEYLHKKGEDPNRSHATVYIEQGRSGKSFSVELPQALIANLLWFYHMETHEPAAHLRSWPYDPAKRATDFAAAETDSNMSSPAAEQESMVTKRQRIGFGVYLAVCLLIDFFPSYGPPHFRYTGSEPIHDVWNLGWPLASLIWDASHGLHFSPTAYLLFPLQAFIFLAALGVIRYLRKR